jgi:hypothetical protein
MASRRRSNVFISPLAISRCCLKSFGSLEYSSSSFISIRVRSRSDGMLSFGFSDARASSIEFLVFRAAFQSDSNLRTALNAQAKDAEPYTLSFSVLGCACTKLSKPEVLPKTRSTNGFVTNFDSLTN